MLHRCLEVNLRQNLGLIDEPRLSSTPPPRLNTAMLKRKGDPLRTGTTKVKKRNQVKIRTLLIPDSDEEIPHSNINTTYSQLVKTRVKASGQANSVTSKILPLLEVPGTANDLPEDHADYTEDTDTILQTVAPNTSEARKKRKKENDSVSLLIYLQPHFINCHSDENAIMA